MMPINLLTPFLLQLPFQRVFLDKVAGETKTSRHYDSKHLKNGDKMTELGFYLATKTSKN